MTSRGLALDDAAWSSPWRERRVADKALLAGGLLACAVTLPAWPGGVLTGLAAATLMLGPAKVRPALLARCLAAPALFVVIGALTILVTVSWDGGPRIAAAPQMVPTALTLLVRGLAGALSMFLLATTTPMIDLFAAMRRARIPDPLIEVASLTYRLVFVLLESARAIREAQEARLGYASRSAAYRSLASLVASVLLRAWTRARRLEVGLAGRGYTDSLRTLDPPRRGSARFVTGSVLLLAVIVAATLIRSHLGGAS